MINRQSLLISGFGLGGSGSDLAKNGQKPDHNTYLLFNNCRQVS